MPGSPFWQQVALVFDRPLPKEVLAYTGGPGDDFEPGQRLIFDAEATELKEIPNSPIAILRVRRGEARRDQVRRIAINRPGEATVPVRRAAARETHSPVYQKPLSIDLITADLLVAKYTPVPSRRTRCSKVCSSRAGLTNRKTRIRPAAGFQRRMRRRPRNAA